MGGFSWVGIYAITGGYTVLEMTSKREKQMKFNDLNMDVIVNTTFWTQDSVRMGFKRKN